MEIVDTHSSSTLYKAMVKLYNLVKKPKNVRLGFEKFLKQEDEVLKTYMLVYEEDALENQVDMAVGEYEQVEDEADEEVGEKKSRKKKTFENLKTEKVKRARVENIVEIMRNDAGLEEGVLDHLKRENPGDEEIDDEAFKLCCLNLMKNLKLSDTKYDDLRWWIEDVLKRGFSLTSMPTSRTLKAKINKEMIPPNMQSSDTGAKFELRDALFHTGERFLERPDIKVHLKAGDTLLHLAKIGSDFQTGLGKMHQKKESEFDEDGSHNSGFKTLKLSLGDQSLFENKAPGGSELLRLFSKTTEKDTQDKIIREMEALDDICKEMPIQEVYVKNV